MSMRPTFEALSAKVVQTFGLQRTDFTEMYNGQAWHCPATGTSGTAEWMSEASPKFLTGVSLTTRANPDGSNEQLSIHIWMGPSFEVPHMLLTFGEQSNGRYSVTADYVVRGSTPIGSDPQYLQTFYGEDITRGWTAAHSVPGAMDLPSSPYFESRLLQSPAKISLGNLDYANAEAIATVHLDRFLSWLDGAQPILARNRGSFNLRDDKLRQFFYRAELMKNVDEFGDGLGQIVGAVNTGPTAEAYVGGGS